MQVRSLGPEDPLKQSMAAHSRILAWRIPRTEAWWAGVHGVAESDTTEVIARHVLFAHLKNNRKHTHAHTHTYNDVCDTLCVLLNFQSIPDRCKKSGSSSSYQSWSRFFISSLLTLHSLVTWHLLANGKRHRMLISISVFRINRCICFSLLKRDKRYRDQKGDLNVLKNYGSWN